MKKRNFMLTVILISLFSLILLQTNPAVALMIELGPEDLTKEADFVLRGEVTDIKCQWNDNKTKIYTYIALTVKEWIVGQSEDKTTTIKQLGGEIGGRGMLVSGSPKFKRGGVNGE